ncbi:MarR family winged helix-turn-helix transcriptional regulator [Tepidamorphus sp. 3E244]|uniref:MarR family winged helix-turn-helix transcriptional regulator n=1 Tax=Tepidamorphus sp. 3E244 TaxID=3385498 RepID=UPI0038FCC040
MTDINFSGADQKSGEDGIARPSQASYEFIELLFFAYRDFISEPDEILAGYEFGRAHHRVLHFVDRNPGLSVADLLEILKITKQSLARVLKQLVDRGFVEQRAGERDRRQRLLHATPEGQNLARTLAGIQAKRMEHALVRLDPAQRAAAAEFLARLINDTERGDVMKIVKKDETA